MTRTLTTPLTLTLLCLTLGLSACRPAPASSTTVVPRSAAQKPGETRPVFYKGVPSMLGLTWGSKTAQTRKVLKAQGWRHVLTRRTARSSAEAYSGRLLGRPTQLMLDHDAKAGLVRVQFTLTPTRDIHAEYRTFVALLERSFGKATSLFTPEPPTDSAYRQASREVMHPITGWVFKNGFAASVAVKQPWKLQNDPTTAIQVTLESATWRAAYRLNRPAQ